MPYRLRSSGRWKCISNRFSNTGEGERTVCLRWEVNKESCQRNQWPVRRCGSRQRIFPLLPGLIYTASAPPCRVASTPAKSPRPGVSSSPARCARQAASPQEHYSGGSCAANATSPSHGLSTLAAGAGALSSPLPISGSRVPQGTAATRIAVSRSLAGCGGSSGR